MSSPVLVWFRRDLRLEDNPALQQALTRNQPVIGLFIWSEDREGEWAIGAASQWWLHHSLKAFGPRLEKLGVTWVLRSGSALSVLKQVIQETGATAVFWNRRYEPSVIARDTEIKTDLTKTGIEAISCNASLLFEPWTIKTGAGKPYQVFTPFWNACLAQPEPARPLPTPRPAKTSSLSVKSENLDEWNLLPRLGWDRGFYDAWTPGEIGAHSSLKKFLAAVANYPTDRNIPGNLGTSRLSPHLHFGEIGPRQIWYAIRHFSETHKDPGVFRGAEIFLKEIGWREFAYHLIYHFPHTPDRPLREPFAKFPWEKNPGALRAWQKGATGYPIVDAGLRELWHTGWMHNRVRMIVASFLVKDLRLSWLDGARWFWDTLVDADLANNTLGWQWSAGCGADAAPYFRVFNPTSQGEKFDPDGDYVRRWIPELKKLPNKWIHSPSSTPLEILNAAGVSLGKTYPAPLVDHAEARQKALISFKTIRAGAH